MLKKTVAVVLTAAVLLLLLTGCWDKKELNELAIVTAFGIDRDKATGRVDLALQVIRPSALNRQQGGSQEAPYQVIETSGRNIVEAIRKANMKLDRRLCFSHLAVIVAGEQAARYGLNGLIDYILRTHEVRQEVWLSVTRDKVSRILSVKNGIENIQASYMEGIIETQHEFLNVTAADVKSFIDKLPGAGVNPVTGMFSIHNEESISAPNNQPVRKEGLIFSGTAAFRKDKLIGFLNNQETRGLNYLINAQKGGHILVRGLENKQSYITIELKNVTCQIDPTFSNGKPTFNIRVNAEGNISQVDDASNVADPKELEKVNREFAASIRQDIRSTITRSQKTLKTDILGFGRAYEEEYPARWKKIKNQWTTYFPDQSVKVIVKTNIKQTGLLLNPLQTN
ncbi:MAG: Ger(x)C family spore germination protein [Sporolactobacillus sp.]|nr:Ger(x)C family spore germination protein [Sporolactobacillus sp.]